MAHYDNLVHDVYRFICVGFIYRATQIIRLNWKAIVRIFQDEIRRIKKLRVKKVHLGLKMNTSYSLSGLTNMRRVIEEEFLGVFYCHTC